MSFIGIVNMATILWVVARNDRFTIKDIVVLLGIPFIMLLSYCTAIVLGRHHPQNSYYFSLFLGFSLPSIFICWSKFRLLVSTTTYDFGSTDITIQDINPVQRNFCSWLRNI
jgi:hypothetical protein